MRLRIERAEQEHKPGHYLTGGHYRYWLDELEITDGLTGLDLTINVDEANRVTLRFMLEDVEVDQDVLAEFQAHVEQRELDEAIATARDAAKGAGSES